GRAAGAEGGHRRTAAEDREIRALALLKQDDEDQEETEQNVNRVQQIDHGVPRESAPEGAKAPRIARNRRGSRLAPPTRKPSMSARAASSAAFSGVTDPP